MGRTFRKPVIPGGVLRPGMGACAALCQQSPGQIAKKAVGIGRDTASSRMGWAALVVLTLCLVFPVEIRAQGLSPGNPDTPQFYFLCSSPKKEINGQFTQILELICPEKDRMHARVFFQESGSSQIYRAALTQGRMKIVSARKAFIRVYAFVRSGGRVMTAATSFFLWGRSETMPQRHRVDAGVLKEAEDLPFVAMKMFKNWFWPQTGQPFYFVFQQGADPNARLTPGIRLKVLEKGAVRQLSGDLNAEQIHVPSHDKGLNQKGAAAFRQDLVFAELAHGGQQVQAAYTFLVHRSRFARNNHRAGGVVLVGSLFFFGGWIGMKRRQPWWRD